MPDDPTPVPTVAIVLDGAERLFRLPFAGLFRDLTADESGRLAASVEKYGVRHPVIVYDSPAYGPDSVIDGANRLRNMARLGVGGDVVKLEEIDDDTARDLAESLNADRRQLTADDFQKLSAERAARLKRVATARIEGESLRTIAEKEGVGESQIRRDLESISTAPGGAQLSQPVDPDKVKGKDGRVRTAHPKKPEKPNPPAAPPADELHIVLLEQLLEEESDEDARVLSESPSPPASSEPVRYPKPEDTPRDQLGRAIPKFLLDTFAKRNECRSASADVGRALGKLRKIDADEELGGFLKRRPGVELDARNLADFIRTRLAPYCVCPGCDGDGDSGNCPSCGGKGWVTKVGYWRLAEPLQQKAKSYKPTDTWEPDEPLPADCSCDRDDQEPARRFQAPGVDANLKPIPKHLRDVFEAEFLFEAVRDLKRLAGVLDDAKGWLPWLKPETHALIAQLTRYVEDAIPHAVCLTCGGEPRKLKSCAACMQSGYHPKWSEDGGRNLKPKPERADKPSAAEKGAKGKKGGAS